MRSDAGRRPLKVITLVDDVGTFGGGERVARRIATHLDRSRFEATFCVSRGEPESDPVHDEALRELREAGVKFLPLNRSSRLQLSPWRKLISYMREWEADVLHTHMIGSNIWGALIAPRVDVPVFIAHEHTWSFEGQPWRKFIDRNLIARRADAFVAVSKEDQRRMVSVERIPESLIRFIPNGIPLGPLRTDGERVRAELGVTRGQPLVGMVAVLRPQKACEVLLRATVSIREAFPEVQILVIGGPTGSSDEGYGGYFDKMRALSSELGLDSTVRFLGARSDVPELLGALDLAVLSSDYEGSPLSVLEYMAAGKPVVATRVGGVPDLVSDGETGLLVERQDPAAFASAVIELLGDRDRAEAMGRAGRERCERLFSIDAMIERFERLYEELYAAKGSGRA